MGGNNQHSPPHPHSNHAARLSAAAQILCRLEDMGHEVVAYATDLHRQMKAKLFLKKSRRFQEASTALGGAMLKLSTDLIRGCSWIACNRPVIQAARARW